VTAYYLVDMLSVLEKKVLRSTTVCTPYKVKEHEIGGICSTYGGEEEYMQGSGRET
jgi:hypothetical protein